jgi:phosphotransferase system enzyme I (PtsP)
MHADGCALFIQHSDGSLELYAAKGLNEGLVHRLFLNPGEGIIGVVALKGQPLFLENVWSHPNFSYHQDCGEEYYRSMLTVPILRGGSVLGVLSIQNKEQQPYREEDVETLQMASMVLSELIVSSGLQSLSRPGAQWTESFPLFLQGTPISEGIGLGYVVFHECTISPKAEIANDIQGELDRLDGAIASLQETIDSLFWRPDISYQGEHLDLLDTLRLAAHDRRWLHRIREAVASGLTAESAIAYVRSHVRSYVITKPVTMSHASLRERLDGLDELTYRLICALEGTSFRKKTLPAQTILVAQSMGLITLLDYDRSRLSGLILEEGGATSHMAIMARAMNVPVIGGIANLRETFETGDLVGLDGAKGEVYVRPTQGVADLFQKRISLQSQRYEGYRALCHVPCVTQDGIPIALHLNLGFQCEMASLETTKADGIGLFRTEFLFLERGHLPSRQEQVDVYGALFDRAREHPITWRTWDVGGDKTLPFMESNGNEKNPALGWRAIRLGLDRPGLLRMQVQSILKAARGRPVNIMFPMVASIEEFEEAKALVMHDQAYLEKRGYEPPSALRLGVMLEVPSLLFQLPQLVQAVDFLSVGSNDLLQFLFAVDRGNKRVAQRFDPLSRAPLMALKTIIDSVAQKHCPVTVCGELASKPLGALVLIGLGYRSLSMAPASIGPIKNMILSLNVGKITHFLKSCLEDNSKEAKPLRLALARFAAEHGISE